MTGLFLSALKLSHFRSHKLAGISADGRPVAIHGPNGAGKTNILEAISLLSPGRGLRRAVADDLARRPQSIGWKIAAEVRRGDLVHEIATWAEPGASRQVRINGKAATQLALGAITPVTWLVPSMDRLWIEGAEGRRRFLDRLTLSFHPGHAQDVLDYEKAMRDRNRLLKDQVRDPHWYRALEAQMAAAGWRLHLSRLATLDRLSQAQASAQTAFPVADLTLLQPEGSEGEDALAGALEASRPRDLGAGRSLVGPHRADLGAIYEAKDIAAKDCSTGEQKALLVSLILANARALTEDKGAPPLLLLDEVAAHLDEARRAALYDEICALGAQAWMTGTGPELFSQLGDRAQWLEVTEEDGESRIAAA